MKVITKIWMLQQFFRCTYTKQTLKDFDYSSDAMYDSSDEYFSRYKKLRVETGKLGSAIEKKDKMIKELERQISELRNKHEAAVEKSAMAERIKTNEIESLRAKNEELQRMIEERNVRTSEKQVSTKEAVKLDQNVAKKPAEEPKKIKADTESVKEGKANTVDNEALKAKAEEEQKKITADTELVEESKASIVGNEPLKAKAEEEPKKVTANADLLKESKASTVDNEVLKAKAEEEQKKITTDTESKKESKAGGTDVWTLIKESDNERNTKGADYFAKLTQQQNYKKPQQENENLKSIYQDFTTNNNTKPVFNDARNKKSDWEDSYTKIFNEGYYKKLRSDQQKRSRRLQKKQLKNKGSLSNNTATSFLGNWWNKKNSEDDKKVQKSNKSEDRQADRYC